MESGTGMELVLNTNQVQRGAQSSDKQNSAEGESAEGFREQEVRPQRGSEREVTAEREVRG